MLGTMVGQKKAREGFLKYKVENEARKIARLKDLPHQHALLLLGFCVQQNLRHLQRSVKSDNLKELLGEDGSGTMGGGAENENEADKGL